MKIETLGQKLSIFVYVYLKTISRQNILQDIPPKYFRIQMLPIFSLFLRFFQGGLCTLKFLRK